MFGSTPRELPQRIGFVLVPSFSMIAFTSAVEPLRLANRASGRELYDWTLCSSDGAPVTASNGITLHPVAPLERAADAATVVVCSGVEVHRVDDRHLLSWLRRADRRGVDIGAVCTGIHGEIFRGESDTLSHLFAYYPPAARRHSSSTITS